MSAGELQNLRSNRSAVVLWGIAAFGVALINMLVKFARLAGWYADRVNYGEIVVYGLAAFLLATVCLFWKDYRSWGTYFKVASVVGALALFSGLMQLLR